MVGPQEQAVVLAQQPEQRGGRGDGQHRGGDRGAVALNIQNTLDCSDLLQVILVIILTLYSLRRLWKVWAEILNFDGVSGCCTATLHWTALFSGDDPPPRLGPAGPLGPRRGQAQAKTETEAEGRAGHQQCNTVGKQAVKIKR